MRVIDLALKDLLQVIRDHRSAFFLVVMPVLFVWFFGMIFGGQGGGGDPRLPVGFANYDLSSYVGTHLLSLLEASDVVRPVILEESSAEKAAESVRDGKQAAALIVPAGPDQTILNGEQMRVTVIVGLNTAAGRTAASAIETAVTRLLSAVQISRLTTEAFETSASFEDGAARQAFQDQAIALAIEAWREPPLSITVEQARVKREDSESSPNAFSQSSPGMIIQFTIFGVMMPGMVLVLERKTGTLQRLLITPMTRAQIIAGKLLGTFVLVLLQQVLLVACSQLLFAVDYMREPLATFLVMVALALWVASLGLFIGANARSEDQVTTWSLIAMFVFSAMGGAWFPLEYTGKAFAAIGHLMPTAWAMDGFQNIVLRGLGLQSVLLPVGVLLGYAVAFFALAVWRFRFE